MGILNILGSITSNPVFGRLMDMFIPDKEKARQFQLEISKMEAEQNKYRAQALSQMMGHKSIFVAGAIPSFLWIGAIGIFLTFIINPIILWLGFDREIIISLPKEYWTTVNVIIGGLFTKKMVDDNEWHFGGKLVSPSKKKLEFEMSEGFRAKNEIDYDAKIKQLQEQYGVTEDEM